MKKDSLLHDKTPLIPLPWGSIADDSKVALRLYYLSNLG